MLCSAGQKQALLEQEAAAAQEFKLLFASGTPGRAWGPLLYPWQDAHAEMLGALLEYLRAAAGPLTQEEGHRQVPDWRLPSHMQPTWLHLADLHHTPPLHKRLVKLKVVAEGRVAAASQQQ
jgi:hypothetical protein